MVDGKHDADLTACGFSFKRIIWLQIFQIKKSHCLQLILQKEYADYQKLFCGQEDTSKTYPSVESSASFCEFWKFEKP